MDLQQHRILKYCSVRFLSIYIVVNRFLKQYQALVKLFTVDIPKYHPKVYMQPRVQRIVAAMNNKYTLPTLYLIQFSLEIFQKYEKLYHTFETQISSVSAQKDPTFIAKHTKPPVTQ